MRSVLRRRGYSYLFKLVGTFTPFLSVAKGRGWHPPKVDPQGHSSASASHKILHPISYRRLKHVNVYVC